MAIDTNYPGLEVAVTVNDSPLQEYDDGDEDSAPNTVTKYIEAQSGAEFAVTAKFKHPFPTHHDVKMCLVIDGKYLNGWVQSWNGLYGLVLKGDRTKWQQNGQWVEQKFCFAELNMVEEARGPLPNVAALKNSLSEKGCITISLQFIKIGKKAAAEQNSPAPQLTKFKEIPEKALKGVALSHQAILSKPQKAHVGREIYTWVPIDKKPFATFHFKYRSLASLKALRIVPPDESLSVPLEERPEEELNEEELRELLRRMRQREAGSKLVKQETATKPDINSERFVNNDIDDEVAVLESRPCKRRRVDQEVIVLD